MKRFCFLLAVLILAALLPSAAAIPLEAEVFPDTIRTDLEMPAVFTLRVANNQFYRDNLKVAIGGPHIHWATSPVILLVVPPNTTKEVNITFFPVEYRGTFDFNITLSSTRNTNYVEREPITIDIPPPLVLHSVSFWREGDAIQANLTLETLRQNTITLDMSLYDTSGVVIDEFFRKLNVTGKVGVPASLTLPEKLLAGEYAIEYTINGTIEGSAHVVVDPQHNVEMSKELVANAMFGTVYITLTNNGNVDEDNYVFKENLPPDSITGFITQPSHCDDSLLGSECNYIIGKLRPGETAQIVYRIEYWPTYVQIMAGVLIVAVIFGFSFIRATKPTITKRSVRKGATSHSVVLEIRNPFLHNLKDVVVRDWVSPLGKVASKGSGLVPVKKVSEAGTELIWKLGDMKPKETRIIAYDIKTLLEARLKMPRAYARFRTPKGKNFRIYSKMLNM